MRPGIKIKYSYDNYYQLEPNKNGFAPPARAHSNSEKQDNNNKDDYHPYPQFAANSHGHNHTRYSKGDVGFGDLGANQNQHSVSWKGPRVFIICLQTRMIHQLCYGCYCWLWERFFS